MKTLAVFGDSWPAGVELQENQKPFGDLLHEMLGTDKYYNMSCEGTAIDSMIMQLDNFIKNKSFEDCVSVFFITNPTRQLYFRNNKFKIYRPTGDKSSEAKFYFSEMQSDEIDEHKANTTILALQRMCSKHNITDIYLEGWTKINFCYSGIDKRKIFEKSAIELFGADVNKRTAELSKYQSNEYIYPNKYHPNQKGHEMIAEQLYNFIK